MKNSEGYITQNTQAILLLCGGLGVKRVLPPEPLTQSEYNQLAIRLHELGMQPFDLLKSRGLEMLREYAEKKVTFSRLEALMGRGAALAFALESWMNQGLWILSRSDSVYPKCFINLLKKYAPPLIYGVGEKHFLNKGGLSIVGSRDVDEDTLYFANCMAVLCAQQDIQVVSGGARGIDEEAMLAALDEGGKVVGVLSHALTQAVRSKKYRDYIHKGQLTLISTFDPLAGFNAGNAMMRNKFIYVLGDWALAVNSAHGKGGTWGGAIDNLKFDRVPLFVRDGEDIPEGNRALIRKGGIPLTQEVFNDPRGIKTFLDDLISKQPPKEVGPDQLPLF
ncbi:MAG: DNA-protecting protein DprA [Anaerolineaceae bacterium]|nr:DNA-protecting protein DprA [Anaerolineaceae bacterium]